MEIRELLAFGEDVLEKAGIEDFKIDAEALLTYEIGFDKTKIFMNWTYDVNFTHSENYFDLVNLRATGMPLQYITGEQFFMGHKFIVNENVLIPRQETEVLVEKTIEMFLLNKNIKTVLDMCTGSGVIAISLANRFSNIKFTAVDVSGKALSVAKQNASALCRSKNISFEHSDLFSAIKSGSFGKKFDLIISNPPYIKTYEIPYLQREILEHEPLIALDGGEDGLYYYRKIITDAIPYFKKGGCLLLEIGADQANDVSNLLIQAGYKTPEIIKDLSGKDRIVKAFR